MTSTQTHPSSTHPSAEKEYSKNMILFYLYFPYVGLICTAPS